MPKPKPGETRDDYVKRCVPVVLKDGTAKTNVQAVAVCNKLFKEKVMPQEADNARKVTFLKKCMAGPNASEKFCAVAWDNAEKKRKAAEAEEKMTPAEASFMKTCMSKDGATHESCHAKWVATAETESSLQDYLNAVRDAFRAATAVLTPDSTYDRGLWTRDVLVDHPTFGDAVITSDKGKTYAVSYTQDDEGNFAFDPVAKWTPVMMTYALAVPPKKPAVPATAEAKKKGGTGSYPWDECIADQLGDGHSKDSANRICASIKAKSQGLGSFKGKSRKTAFKKAADAVQSVPVILLEEPGTEDYAVVAFSMREMAREFLDLGARDPWALVKICYERACDHEVQVLALPDESFALILGEERLLPVRSADGIVVPDWVTAAKEMLYEIGLLPGMREETRKTLDRIGGTNE
jgi:hypothetical protein